jgi:hypothetical protein
VKAHLFGAFEAAHYRPKERPNSVPIVHPKTGEEAWWPLHDERARVSAVRVALA